jgi:SAM-dependent methyltransferase
MKMTYLGRLHRYRRRRLERQAAEQRQTIKTTTQPPPPRCLEIGPGQHPTAFHARYTATWDKLDFLPGPHITIAARWGLEPLPIPANTYDLVYASHVLEHIEWTRTIHALREVLRILKPGGAFEVWVPDFAKLATTWLFACLPPDSYHSHRSRGTVKTWCNDRIFGDGANPGRIHRAMFDDEHLLWCLTKAGFTDVQLLTRDIRAKGRGHRGINLGARGVKMLKGATMRKLRLHHPEILARKVR